MLRVQGRIASGRRRHLSGARRKGWTLVELLVVIALIGTISSIVVPHFISILKDVQIKKVVKELRMIEMEIKAFERFQERLPTDLDELEGGGTRVDRWGNPYQYLPNLNQPGWNGQARKDRFLVPLNSDFDLYSMGPDGESRSPLTAQPSRDDIVRANDGLYIGPASDF